MSALTPLNPPTHHPACHSSVVLIDALLLPCCSTFDALMEGSEVSDGYSARYDMQVITTAPQMQSFLTNAREMLSVADPTRSFNVLVPSQRAWSAFLRAVAYAGLRMDDELYNAVFSYLIAASDTSHEDASDATRVISGAALIELRGC